VFLGLVLDNQHDQLLIALAKLDRNIETQDVLKEIMSQRFAQVGGLQLLQLAVVGCNQRCAELLLHYGADANAPVQLPPAHHGLEFACTTALQLAALRGSPFLVRTLLSHGARIGDTNGDGMSALHMASCAEVARALLDAGADLRLVDLRGRTPLHTALYELGPAQCIEVVRVLSAAGAPWTQPDADGVTAASLLLARHDVAMTVPRECGRECRECVLL
jgi:hypothetical protein